MKIRAIVADDERLARQGLILRLSKFHDVEVIGEASDGKSVMHTINRLNPNVVFLDIEMPGMIGTEVAKSLSKNASPPLIIFVTAYMQYAAGAFEIPALDYLLKPVSEVRIQHCLERIRNTLAHLQMPELEVTITIKNGDENMIIHASEIEYIEAAGDFTVINAGVDSYVHNATLKSLANLLSKSGIVQIHRSTLVARKHIEKITNSKNGDGKVTLRSGATMKYSRSFKKNIL